MQRRSCEIIGHSTTHGQGDGKTKRPFWKVQLADAVDFSSFCRLCATCQDPEKMTSLFEDPVSPISSKLSEVIRIQVTDGDGLPALICSRCLVDLNFVNEFIEKSLAADRLLRKAIIKACKTIDACPPALFEVEVEDSFEPIEIKEESFAFDGLPITFEGKPITCLGPNTEDDNGDHSYSQSSDWPLNSAVPRKFHIKDDQRLTVTKLGEHCETKHGHINFVDGLTGRTTRVPLECRVVSRRVIDRAHSHSESEQPAFIAPTKSEACGPIARNLFKPKPIPGNANANAHQANRPPKPPKASECELCGKRYWRRAQLRDHMHTHTGERPYACAKCDKAYTVRTHLNMHVRVKHPSASVRSTTAPQKLLRYECEICNYRAPAPSSLKMHMRVHTNSRPFACPICGKGFKQGSHLKGHMPTHKTDKPHVCTVCGKKFKVKRACVVHEAAHVRKPPPRKRTFQCHVCGKAFAYKNLLETHVARHDGGIRDFECSHCAKRFVDRASVKRHIELVHLRERPLPCAVCGHAFKLAHHVKRHMFRFHGIDSSARTYTSPEEMIPG